ncbi:hypothetical protein Patl1_22529 [Pistacia atlantica]|uniref:Uncharacterized protein n=1 Tax=Pistacia atlantica TaxID=434234 RepID=A0ACC0ZYH2_9ROSI|nr:hypothetical protein Patl1_22529 [Pistacia atlantica]
MTSSLPRRARHVMDLAKLFKSNYQNDAVPYFTGHFCPYEPLGFCPKSYINLQSSTLSFSTLGSCSLESPPLSGAFKNYFFRAIKTTGQDAERGGAKHGSLHPLGSVPPPTGSSPPRTTHLFRSTLDTWMLMAFTPANSPLLLSVALFALSMVVEMKNAYKAGFGAILSAGGDADSALDRLWQKKKVEVRQQ